jgi:hypothetical protein
MSTRALFSAIVLVLALAACRDPDAPRPATVFATPTPSAAAPTPAPPLSSREPATPATPVTLPPSSSAPPPAAPPPGLPDPAEQDISGLARVARYVFREMRVASQACPFTNPLHDPLTFVFHIEVQGGRMTEVHLAKAGRQVGQQVQVLAEIPPELAAYAACLEPRLQAVVMDPAPPDDVYQPEYSYPGHALGR